MNVLKIPLQSFLPLIFSVFLIPLFTSCNSVDKTGPCHKITVHLDTSDLLLWTENDPLKKMKAANVITESILRRRLEHYGFDAEAIEIKRNDSSFSQTISIWKTENRVENPRIFNLLQLQGNLQFWETYELTELIGDLTKISGAAESEGDTLFKFLQLNLQQGGRRAGYEILPGPLVGYCKDTARVMKIIRRHIEKLPADLTLAWMEKKQGNRNAVDANFFSLISLKGKKINPADNGAFEKRNKSKNGPCLWGSIISDARFEKDENSGFHIEFSMFQPAAQKWAKLTKENISKAVAIVLDGYVYSYPVVQSEITNGNCWISGNFTKEEAKDMAAMLSFGQLPLPLKIVSQEYK